MIFLISVLAIIIGRLIFNKWNNPFLVIWGVLLIWTGLYEFGPIKYQEVSFNSEKYILLINAIMSAGVCISYKFINIRIQSKEILSLNPISIYFILFLSVLGIYFIGGLENLISIISSGLIIRDESSQSSNENLIYWLFIYPVYIITPASFYYYIRTGLNLYLCPLILVIIIAFIGASRALMLIFILICLNIYIVTSPKKLIINSLKFLVLIIAVFLIIGQLRDGDLNSDIDYYSDSVIPQSVLVAFHYVAGSYSALNDYLNESIILESGAVSNVFPFIAKIYSIFDSSITVNSYKYQLSFESPKTNVYSVYKEIYADFGDYGSLIFSMTFGLLFGLFYKSIDNDILSPIIIAISVLYTFIMYSIFYSIFIFLPVFLSLLLAFLIKKPREA